jgi:hypothetical protein
MDAMVDFPAPLPPSKATKIGLFAMSLMEARILEQVSDSNNIFNNGETQTNTDSLGKMLRRVKLLEIAARLPGNPLR